MDNEYLNPGTSPEMDSFEREERCRKNIRTVSKAIFMRLFVTGILAWVLLGNGLEIWVTGLILFVLIINLSGMFPLVQELKKRRKELKEIIAEDEA